jgi:transketolase
MREAEASPRPTLIVARTEKGHGVSFLANEEGWHGKALDDEQADKAIAELGGERGLQVTPPSPPAWTPVELGSKKAEAAPAYDAPVATRKAFGQALAWLAGHRPDLVVLDGEVSNSTYTEDMRAVAPERFVEMYIAEQVLLGAQTGLQAMGKTAFAATFGAFWTRAFDQIRMGAVSHANLRLVGTHAGVSIGEDGPSQMALEDLASFRALNGSTVLYPADGTATVKLVAEMCDLEGISYLRATREGTAVLYTAEESFPIGGSKTLRSSGEDRVALVGAGITVHECLEAADLLAADGIGARVIDCYSVKPIDTDTLRKAMVEIGLVVTVEDHRIEGGLGEAVLSALAGAGELSGRVVGLGVRDLPGSGTPTELRSWAGIDAASIAARVRDSLG